VLYLDSSAIMKLVVPEPGSASLAEEIARDADVVSSEIALTEVVRAVGRAKGRIGRAERIVSSIALVPIDRSILAEAAAMHPGSLRSLDAIHLVSALSLRPDVDAFIAYDARLLGAASKAGLIARSPGVS
jgi:predicted nucleic acid-binding protein